MDDTHGTDRAGTGGKPCARVIKLDLSAPDYTRVLSGPPETVTMRSGLVVLRPSLSVGKHNTESYEEVLLVLAGCGQMLLADGTVLPLEPNTVAYCPPDTEHNVTCTGSESLRYIYLVARTR